MSVLSVRHRKLVADVLDNYIKLGGIQPNHPLLSLARIGGVDGFAREPGFAGFYKQDYHGLDAGLVMLEKYCSDLERACEEHSLSGRRSSEAA